MSTYFTKVFDYQYIDISINENIESIIKKHIMNDVSNLIFRNIKHYMLSNRNSIEYHCFECKKKIKINIIDNLINNKRIPIKDFLCEEHLTVKIDEKSISFFRYENIFYKKLKEFYSQLT